MHVIYYGRVVLLLPQLTHWSLCAGIFSGEHVLIKNVIISRYSYDVCSSLKTLCATALTLHYNSFSNLNESFLAQTASSQEILLT